MASAAVALYSDEDKSVLFSAQVQATGSRDKSENFDFDDDWVMSSNETWINFDLRHDINEKIGAFAVFEWQLDPFIYSTDIDGTEKSNLFENRLGYVGVTGDVFGSLTFGKQWSSTYQLLGMTDKLYVAKPDASAIYQIYDGGVNGNGRLDQGIIYQNDYSGLSFAVQYGDEVPLTTGLVRSDNWGGMMAYHFDFGLIMGAAYSKSTLASDPDEAAGTAYYGLQGGDEITTANISFSFQSEKVYIGLNLVDGTNAHVNAYAGEFSLSNGPLLADAQGGDIYLDYKFDNLLQPYAYYSYLKFEDQQLSTTYLISGARQMMAGGLLFNMSEHLSFGLEYRHHELERHNYTSQGSANTLALQLQYLL